MKKEEMQVTKYVFERNSEKYIIYLIPEEDNITGFYIQKEKYGIISHAIGIDLKMLEEKSLEDFIKERLEEWIMICNKDINI